MSPTTMTQPGDQILAAIGDVAARMVSLDIRYESAMLALEKAFIAETLIRAKGNQCQAAREIGVHRNTLRRKIAQMCIDVKAGAR